MPHTSICDIAMYRKVSVKELRVDMFIAELDRPWNDTPFLLQGFLIDDAEQLRQLREYCQWVMVDPARSIGREYDAPSRVAPPERRDLGDAPRVQINRVESAGGSLTVDTAHTGAPAPPRTMGAPGLAGITPQEPGNSQGYVAHPSSPANYT